MTSLISAQLAKISDLQSKLKINATLFRNEKLQIDNTLNQNKVKKAAKIFFSKDTSIPPLDIPYSLIPNIEA